VLPVFEIPRKYAGYSTPTYRPGQERPCAGIRVDAAAGQTSRFRNTPSEERLTPLGAKSKLAPRVRAGDRPASVTRESERRLPAVKRAGPPRDTHTTEKGGSTMTGVAVGAEREQIIRWMEEGRNILEIIVKLLNDADQLKMAADATQKENERLRYECDQLRREVNELHADHERSKKERAEIAQWFSSVMSEAASRLLVERPPA